MAQSLFGSLKRLTSIVFRQNNQDISLDSNQATTYTTARLFQLPPGDSDQVLVSESSTQTLTNKTLTTPVISTISNTGTLTLPTSTDTLVGRATTDTLTNKTLTSPVISTISNTGTLTLPTATDTLVGRATTDTLTNKTISFSGNTMTGRTSGTAVASGEVGQVVTQATTPSFSASSGNVESLSLAAGVWLVSASFYGSTATTDARFTVWLTTTSAQGFSGANATSGLGDGAYFSTANDTTTTTGPKYFNLSSTTTIYLVLAATANITASNVYFQAVRIA